MTSYETVINRFYRRIEKDMKFFSRSGLSKEQCMELARQQAMGFMEEAICEIEMDCMPKINFEDRDDRMAMFREDLTTAEIYLISLLMYRQYLDRDIAYIKLLENNYVSTELRVFSASESRETWLKLYDAVDAKCTYYKDQYRNTDRLTGEFAEINYSNFSSLNE